MLLKYIRRIFIYMPDFQNSSRIIQEENNRANDHETQWRYFCSPNCKFKNIKLILASIDIAVFLFSCSPLSYVSPLLLNKPWPTRLLDPIFHMSVNIDTRPNLYLSCTAIELPLNKNISFLLRTMDRMRYIMDKIFKKIRNWQVRSIVMTLVHHSFSFFADIPLSKNWLAVWMLWYK